MIDVSKITIRFDDTFKNVRWYRISVFVDYDYSDLEEFYKHMDEVVDELGRLAPCRYSGADRKELILLFGTFDAAVICMIGLMKGIYV